jgi:hypothetical protein
MAQLFLLILLGAGAGAYYYLRDRFELVPKPATNEVLCTPALTNMISRQESEPADKPDFDSYKEISIPHPKSTEKTLVLYMDKMLEDKKADSEDKDASVQSTGTGEPSVNKTAGQEWHGKWPTDEFLQGARAYNRALAAYKRYQQTKGPQSVLRGIEADCRTAVKLFEATQSKAPPTVNIGQYITQCYGLISYVRYQTFSE